MLLTSICPVACLFQHPEVNVLTAWPCN